MAPSPRLVAMLFGAGALLGVACTGTLPGSEDSDVGESTIDCPIGSLNCQCTVGGTCDPGLVCAAKLCTPGPDGTDTGDDSTGDAPTTGDISEETTPAECDPGGDGSADPACPPDQPYCLAGTCHNCTGIDCAAVTPNLPMCDTSTGLCSACACDEANPVCDPEAHTCGQCTEHGQCPASACDLWTGGCFPVAGALWVDRDDPACNDAASGTAADPLCSLAEAFARVQDDPQVAHAIRVQPADYSVDAVLQVPAGGKVALVHATSGDDGPMVKITTAEAQTITVDAGGALLIDAVELIGSGGDALGCDAGQLWLDRLTVSGALGNGIKTVNCDVTLRRSVLTDNVLSGANISDGDAHFENSYISSNGNGLDGYGGVYLAGGASLVAVYTSFIDNLAVAGNPFSVACNIDPLDTGIEKVDVRNSVAVNKGMATLCDDALVRTTGWSAPGDPGETNIAIQFVELADYLTPDPTLAGVYRAIPGTTLDQLATWEAGDPEIDFDGDPRPSGENSPDFAGADRVLQ